jgi:GTPase SAR1 family protein
MESLPTVISLSGALYKQKGPIQETWNALSAKWFGKKQQLLITGMAGVGKTTLLDCLSGKVFQENYRLPARSTTVERSQRVLSADSLRDGSKKRIAYAVIPGQASSVRRDGFAELLTAKTDVAGIIHVVSGGLATLDDITELDLLKYKGILSIDAYRKAQRQRELADLDETCMELERYMVGSRRPVWLLLTVNKIDLFHETLGEVTAFYTNPDGPFVQRLRQLQDRVGSLYFQWEVMPVCSWLDNFAYNGQTLPSQFKQTDFRQYLTAFFTKLITKL